MIEKHSYSFATQRIAKDEVLFTIVYFRIIIAQREA